MANYAHPEVLVSTDWVAENTNNPSVRIVEVDVDTKAYDEGHIPGAVGWAWNTQLCDTVQRDIVPKGAFEELMGGSGISNDTTVIIYGDNNNWFAAWALWQLKIYGHGDVRLMNGGREKWVAEGRDLTTDAPALAAVPYAVSGGDSSIRAFLADVQKSVAGGTHEMVDVRSPDEFSGKILSPPGLPETCQRGGHIPGASNIPWAKACNEDGAFKGREALAVCVLPGADALGRY